MENECIFCKIANGKLPCEKIWEDENFIAFLDKNPVGIGHTLLIPKKHFRTFLDVDENFSKKYIFALQNVGKILMKKYNSDGFNIVLNNGKNAGQVVNHVHFHLLPRREGDNQRGIFIG
jgi:histidine triad (HIT) family protein